MLNTIVLINIIGLYFYTDIHWITGLTSISFYIIYIYLYKLSFNNIYFALSITPKQYSEPIHGSHKLITCGFSTIHSIFMSLCSTIYLLQIIDNYYIKQALFISMNYYLADIYYVITSSKNINSTDYCIIIHHIILVYYQVYIFIQTDMILEYYLLYYLNRGLLSEYSIPFLNYSWYLINTNQTNSKKLFVSSIITIILYFITRVCNFTLLIYNFWIDGLLLVGIFTIPLFLINYYWFYKLFCKALHIYKKKEN
jgi:hypothetical protein